MCRKGHVLVAGFCCQQEKPGASFLSLKPDRIVHQCWDLSVSRSNEQIKFKLSSGRKRPVLELRPTASQELRLCGTTETKTCCKSPAAWPPSGTTHALHTLPCFSRKLCGRAVTAKDADLLSSSQEMGLWHELTSAECPQEGGFFSNAIWDGLELFLRSVKGQRPLLPSSVFKLEAELPDQLHLVFEVREI